MTDIVARLRADIERKLAPTRRPALGLRLERMAEDDARVSKVGGLPYATPGAEWPRDRAGPLAFLAQLHLAEAPRLDGFPMNGMLQIFIGTDDRYGMADRERGASSGASRHRLIYHPAPLPRHEALPLAPLEASARTPHDPEQAWRIRYTPFEEVMSADDHRFDAAVGTPRCVLEEEWQARYGIEPVGGHPVFPSGRGHKLGGYPAFSQWDPRPKGSKLELLLQLESGEAMMWGDCGVANFFIDPEALARCDFSQVLYTWDCG